MRPRRTGPAINLPIIAMRLVLLGGFFAAALPRAGGAQSSMSVVAAVGTHTLTVPWLTGPITAHFYPGVLVGIERPLTRGRARALYHTLNAGFFQHHWMTGAYLDAELGVRQSMPLNLRADLRLGAGYLHHVRRRPSFVLRDGTYQAAADWGRPSLMAPVSLMLGYRGGARPPPVAPFATAKWFVQWPFGEEIPAMTHLLMAVGARLHPFRSANP